MTELGEIPNEWYIVNLGNISKLIDGDRSSRYPGEKDIVEDGVLFLSTQNIVNSKLIYDNSKFISEKKFNELSKGKLEKDDLVITLRGSIGNVAKFNGDFYDTGFINAQLMIIRSNNIDANYLCKYLISSSSQKQIRNISSGSAQPQLTKGELKLLKVIVPTKSEQEKIASILSTVDKQIDNVDELIEKNKELKKGLMQTLLTKGIGHTKFKNTEIGEIPEEWEVKKLKEVISVGPQNGLYKSKEFYIGDEYKIVELKDLYTKSREININELSNIKIDDKEIKQYKLKKDDLLVNRVSKAIDGVGRMKIVPDTLEIVCYESNMMRITLDFNLTTSKFIYYLSESEVFRKQVMKNAKVSNQTSISQGDLQEIIICLPNIKEQEKISSILLEIDEKIEKYQNKKQRLEELKKGLMQQLLTGKIRVV